MARLMNETNVMLIPLDRETILFNTSDNQGVIQQHQKSIINDCSKEKKEQEINKLVQSMQCSGDENAQKKNDLLSSQELLQSKQKSISFMTARESKAQGQGGSFLVGNGKQQMAFNTVEVVNSSGSGHQTYTSQPILTVKDSFNPEYIT